MNDISARPVHSLTWPLQTAVGLLPGVLLFGLLFWLSAWVTGEPARANIGSFLAEDAISGKWSPDGRLVAFIRREMVSADAGGDPRRVSNLWVCRPFVTPSHERNITEFAPPEFGGITITHYEWLPSSRYLIVRYGTWMGEQWAWRRTVIVGAAGGILHPRILDDGQLWVGPFIELVAEDVVTVKRFLRQTEPAQDLPKIDVPPGYMVHWAASPSPDGSRFFYLVQHWEGPQMGTDAVPDRSELWMWDRATNRHERISDKEHAQASNPKWSPDGCHLTFLVDASALRPAPSVQGLWIWDLAKRKARRVASGRIERYVWSPNGESIAYPVAGPGGLSTVWVVDPRTGESRKIAEIPGSTPVISWSPKGRKLAVWVNEPGREFESDAHDAIWIVQASGHGEPRRVVWSERGRWGPFELQDWSPDDSHILVRKGREPHCNLVIFTDNGSL